MNELLQYLLVATNVAKKLHWETKSFAVHIALDELHGKLIELTDELAEQYFGAFGNDINLDVNNAQVNIASPQQFILDMVVKLEQFEPVLKDLDSLKNTYDELKATALKTKYKLDNLK